MRTVVACIVLVLAAGSRARAEQALEHQVKAAFLLNFTRFIEWPAAALPPEGQPFSICIVGDDPFGPAIDKIVEGESVAGRPLEVRRLERRPQTGCQIIYSAAPGGLVSRERFGVLVVGEGPACLHAGGIIAFVVENRRVRFDVNQAVAAEAGLRMSSKLLSVARRVER